MKDQLPTLIRVKKWAVDELRRELGALLARQSQLEQGLRMIGEEILREQQVSAAGGMIALPGVYDAYIKRRLADRDRFQAALRDMTHQIERKREQIGEAFRELKTYERTKELRDEEAAQERARRDQAVLDEIGQNAHRLASEGVF